MKRMIPISILASAFIAAVVMFNPWSNRLPKTPVLTNVMPGMVIAYEEFPTVENLSEIGENLRQTDLSQFDYVLVESEGSTMQLAISWWDKKWEFRGTCDHSKMHLWLVMGEKSIKEFEPNEWVLIPPATMTLVFQRTTGTWPDTRSPSITCSNLKWTIDK